MHQGAQSAPYHCKLPRRTLMPHQSLIPHIQLNVSAALNEDLRGGDLTAHLIPARQTATARIISRQEAELCGTLWVEECFLRLDPGCDGYWKALEGEGL